MGLFYTLKGVRIGFFSFAVLLLCLALLGGCSAGQDDKSGQKGAQSGAGTGDVIDQGKLHFDAGITNLYAKEYDSAIEEFNKSLEYNPHSPSAFNNIGFAYFDKGEIDLAMEYQARALEADPEFANAYFGLALALESKGRKEGALKNWKEFLNRTEPGSKWAQKAQKHIEKLEKSPPAKAE